MPFRKINRDFLLALTLALAAHAGIFFLSGTPEPAASDDVEPFTVSNTFFTSTPTIPPAATLPWSLPTPPPAPPHPIPVPEPVSEPIFPPAIIATSSRITPMQASLPRAIEKLHPARSSPAPRHSIAKPASTSAIGAYGPNAGNSGIRYLYNPRPPYPEEARTLRQQGLVIIGADISASGRVTLVRLSHSSGFPILDQAALRAVQQWVFTPATKDGVKIPTHADIPVRFSLDH